MGVLLGFMVGLWLGERYPALLTLKTTIGRHDQIR